VSVKSNFATDTRLHSGGTASVSQVIGSAVALYRPYMTETQSLDLVATG
jgi:hypothetical protein